MDAALRAVAAAGGHAPRLGAAAGSANTLLPFRNAAHAAPRTGAPRRSRAPLCAHALPQHASRTLRAHSAACHTTHVSIPPPYTHLPPPTAACPSHTPTAPCPTSTTHLTCPHPTLPPHTPPACACLLACDLLSGGYISPLHASYYVPGLGFVGTEGQAGRTTHMPARLPQPPIPFLPCHVCHALPQVCISAGHTHARACSANNKRARLPLSSRERRIRPLYRWRVGGTISISPEPRRKFAGVARTFFTFNVAVAVRALLRQTIM